LNEAGKQQDNMCEATRLSDIPKMVNKKHIYWNPTAPGCIYNERGTDIMHFRNYPQCQVES
jgi:hypothetical protein